MPIVSTFPVLFRGEPPPALMNVIGKKLIDSGFAPLLTISPQSRAALAEWSKTSGLLPHVTESMRPLFGLPPMVPPLGITPPQPFTNLFDPAVVAKLQSSWEWTTAPALLDLAGAETIDPLDLVPAGARTGDVRLDLKIALLVYVMLCIAALVPVRELEVATLTTLAWGLCKSIAKDMAGK